jgi:hypothetical protein
LIDDLPPAAAPGKERSEGVVVEDVVDYCAGLDVHRDTVVATVRFPEGNRRCSVTKTFGTDTAELVALGDWLISQSVTRVGLESTGVYWKPVFYQLEERIAQVWLLNAQHLKNVPGRKTDVADSAWIAQLVEHGLVSGSDVADCGRQQRSRRPTLGLSVPGHGHGDPGQPGHGAGRHGFVAGTQHRHANPPRRRTATGAGPVPRTASQRSDGQVDESDSQGEVARTCGADDQDGIAPATTGWTTITLPVGRYELACNNAGHYLAGMYTELDVVAQPD